MLTASTESSHLGWRAALLMHALCGQLAGMQRRGADVAGRSASACAEVGDAFLIEEPPSNSHQARHAVCSVAAAACSAGFICCRLMFFTHTGRCVCVPGIFTGPRRVVDMVSIADE